MATIRNCVSIYSHLLSNCSNDRFGFIQLSDGTERSSLGGLTTSVRVNLSIEHEDVYIFAAGDDVVETAVTDVVRGRCRETNECLVEGTHRHHR